ncbi:P-selectin-like isoform X6 [Dreissena polymorpha]|uniref:P-selectin-like isoform X6 n=1 Tax=Dreissena polymorpha TaxID=45954 RepID=UPI0022644A1B|nr:P-selectin-like isoform X6 [Dreissena polymorpha]
MEVFNRMCSIKVFFILVIVNNDLPDSVANIPSSIQHAVGSCSFTNNDTCGYDVISQWGIHKGHYLFMGHQLLNGGKDNDFYALFDPPHYPLNAIPRSSYSMTSPLLPEGKACLSFYYVLPASIATLNVRIRTEENDTVLLWSVTGRGIRNWTREKGLFLANIHNFVVEFVGKTSLNAYIGVDNITIESFTCENGYEPIKEDVLEVCAGRSNHVPECEPVDCGYLMAPQHGNVSYTNTTYGSTATLSCQTGYILNGSNTSSCDSSGRWDSTGQTCVVIDCGRLTAPQHGNVSQINTTYGSTATISCQTGYILNGSNTSSCDSSRYWNSTTQTCDVLDCGYLIAPQHGNVSHINTTYGSTATISCQTGYILNGSNTSSCDSSGRWDSTGQTCVVIDCGHLTAPQHGNVSQINTTYGSTATISCQTGYILNGSNTSSCDSSGFWNSTTQTCTVLDCGYLTAPHMATCHTPAPHTGLMLQYRVGPDTSCVAMEWLRVTVMDIGIVLVKCVQLLIVDIYGHHNMAA